MLPLTKQSMRLHSPLPTACPDDRFAPLTHCHFLKDRLVTCHRCLWFPFFLNGIFSFQMNYSLKRRGREGESSQILLDLLKLLLSKELGLIKRYRRGIPQHWSWLSHCSSSSCTGLCGSYITLCPDSGVEQHCHLVWYFLQGLPSLHPVQFPSPMSDTKNKSHLTCIPNRKVSDW